MLRANAPPTTLVVYPAAIAVELEHDSKSTPKEM